MNEGKEPGKGGTLEEGKDTGETDERRGLTGRAGMLPLPTQPPPLVLPPLPQG